MGIQVRPRNTIIGILKPELRVGSLSNFMEESVCGALMLVRIVANSVTW